jgi:hypothetical protein
MGFGSVGGGGTLCGGACHSRWLGGKAWWWLLWWARGLRCALLLCAPWLVREASLYSTSRGDLSLGSKACRGI